MDKDKTHLFIFSSDVTGGTPGKRGITGPQGESQVHIICLMIFDRFDREKKKNQVSLLLIAV